jgi:tyrosinase
VRGESDASALRVYIDLPDGVDPASRPDLLAGSVAPFGMRKASRPDDEHGGQGLTFVLDVTEIVEAVQAAGRWDADQLSVRIVPRREIPGGASIEIGRISIYREA